MRRNLGLVIGYGLSALVMGCGGDTTAPVTATHGFWALRLDHHAVNLALTTPDTVRLHATPVDVAGNPLSGTWVVHYHVADSAVTVDSTTGIVTARYVTHETRVIASVTVQGVTLTDTARLRVDATPPAAPLATFSIQSPDSSKVAVDYRNFTDNAGNSPPTPTVFVFATVATGDAATNTICRAGSCALLVAFSVSDPTVATIDTAGVITPHYPGRVTIYATTDAYGVTKTDSLLYVIGYPITPLVNNFALQQVFRNGRYQDQYYYTSTVLTVGVGAVVYWINTKNTKEDIQFNNPAAVQGYDPWSEPGGNIAPFDNSLSDGLNNPKGTEARTFPFAGTYTFHSQTLGVGGVIIVSGGP